MKRGDVLNNRRWHIGEDGWTSAHGVHRDRAWYSAIAEANQRFLGV
jgi:hypothetical protein